MADNPDEPKEKEVRFTPSPKVWTYLQWLADNTMLGKSPNEVAQRVLIQRLTEMRGEDYKIDKL